ncbi:MAG TPA: serine hydrolase domain-containing protein, partial [bacterium]|nr:serine hydrolase domain-containing protein [bacterium]
WSYANGGYDIIQQLLEDVTGQPYDRFMAATVLEPLGMARSSYVEPLPEARLAEAATAHEISGAELADGPISIPEEAAGGLWTTPSDLCLVIQDLLGALNGESGHLLSPAMAKQMVTPGLGDWGLGCEVGTFKDGFHFGHGGDTRGFHTDLLAFNHGDGYVFMTNGDGGSTLEDDVRRTLAQAYGWPLFQPKTLPHAVNVDAGLLHRYAGRYMAQGFHLPMTFKVVEGQLVLDQPGYPGRRLVAADDHTFIGKESGSEVTFSLDANGTVVGASCTLSDGLQLGLDRVPPLKIRGAEPGAQIAPKRAFLDLSKDGPLGGVWCSDATMTAEVRSGQIQYRFDSGLKWGCSNFFPSNVSPLAQATAVDLRGYDSIQFQAKAPDKLVFLIHLSEAGSAAPDAKAFHGLHGSDGESYVFPALAGTGQWETYAVNLADGALRQEWGNQHGNGVLDLQAVDNLDFVIPGGQGKGELLVKDLEFRSAGQ